MKPANPLLFRAAIAPLLFSASLPAANAPEPGGDTAETYVLSPFVVAELTEKGYAATNTLEGSRLNTALRDTPGAISIFTKDFLEDIAATELEDILRYDLSAEISKDDITVAGGGVQANMFGDRGAAFRVRGLTGGWSVDGFRSASEPNTYNVERVGSTRGPNAILFGTAPSGGNLNFRTRAASPTRNLASLEFKVADESTRRAALDVNRALIKDRLALRLMAVRERKGSPQPHKYTDFQGVTLAANYRFHRDTELSVSYASDHKEGVTGRDWNHIDGISRFVSQLNTGQIRWNQALERYENANGTALVNSVAGTGNVSNRTILIYGPDMTIRPELWEGATQTANRITLSTNASLFDFNTTAPIVDEGYERFGSVTPSGAGEFAWVNFRSLTATFSHRLFSSVFMELAFNRSERRSDTTLGRNPILAADLNFRLPDGRLNPYFLGNGYYYSQQNFLRQQWTNDDDTIRASFSYEHDFGKRWGMHRFAVMAERNINRNTRWRANEVWANRPYNILPENAANQVFRRRYFKIGGPAANYTSGYQPGNPTSLESFDSAFGVIGTLTTDWAPPNDRDFDDELTTDSYMAVMQNYLFDRRLVTTLGVRHDSIGVVGPRVLRDATTGKFRMAGASDQPVYTPLQRQWFTTDENNGLRKSFGAVLHLTRNFSLTANYSIGVSLGDRNRSCLPEELTPPPIKGSSTDYGVAFSFLENRISGSIKRFESKSVGEISQGGEGVFVNPNNDVMSSFEYYFRAAGLTSLGADDPIRNVGDLTSAYFSTADSYLSDRVSTGIEVELFANPTRNWTFRAGYAFTDRTTTNLFNEGVPWWADRVALWKSLDTLYTARTGRPSIYNQPTFSANQAFLPVSVAQRIAQSDTALETLRLAEQQAYGNRPHKANLWTRYTFSTGRLRGIAVGGGWRYQSANVAGVHLATGRKLWGNPRSLGDLFLQYRTRGLAGIWANAASVTYQLNVTNFLDDRTIVATKLDVDSATGTQFYRRAYREDPRFFAFTLRMEF